MNQTLIYAAYVLAAVGALAVYFAMPKEARPSRKAASLIVGAIGLGALAMFLGSVGGQTGSEWIFLFLAVVAIGSAVRVITHTRPVYSALFFMLVVLATAALMFMVGAEFLGAALVIVYAGAILVTYVFVIMLAQSQGTGASGEQFSMPGDYDRSAREPLVAVVAGFLLIGSVAGVIVNKETGLAKSVMADHGQSGNVIALGQLLLSPGFAVSVEVAGVLLMVAMIGAIAIARKKLPSLVDSSIDVLPPGEIGKHVKPF